MKWRKTQRAWREICREIGTYLNFNPLDTMVASLLLTSFYYHTFISFLINFQSRSCHFLKILPEKQPYESIYLYTFIGRLKTSYSSFSHLLSLLRSLKNFSNVWLILGWKIVSIQEVECKLLDIWLFSRQTNVSYCTELDLFFNSDKCFILL